MRTLIAAALLLSAAAAHAAGGITPPQAFAAVRLQSGGQTLATFSRCSHIGTENEVDVSMGVGPLIQSPGRLHVGDVVCTRAASSDTAMWVWHEAVVNGTAGARKNGSLDLMDTSGNVALSWLFFNGWLSKISYNLGGPITETIVLTPDALSRDGSPLAPPIDWTPAALTYGEMLGVNQLNATTAVAGTLTYDPPAGTLLSAGVHTLHATFVPDDATLFKTVTVTAEVTVQRALLTARADDKTKTYGQTNPPLTYTLTGFVNGETSSVVSGAATLSTTATTTSDEGSYAITIEAGSLTAANYSFQFANGTLVIRKARQTIDWSTPAPILYGTPLGSAQLNATVSVIGPAPARALTYSPAAGTLLEAGDQVLTVNAAETNNYEPASATVHLTVLKATPSFFDLSSPVIAKGTATTTLSGRIAAGVLIPPAGELVSIALNGVVQPALIQAGGTFSSVFATAALPVSVTPYPIAYSYAGDRNFNGVSGSGGLTVAYIDSFTGSVTTPAADNGNANRPFRAKFSGAMTGSLPGDFTAFVNYTPLAAGPNVTSIVTEGTWQMHVDGKKPAPKGILSGNVTGGTIQWNAAGTKASIELHLTIDHGAADFAGTTGTAVFRNGIWDTTVPGTPAATGQLLLFY